MTNQCFAIRLFILVHVFSKFSGFSKPSTSPNLDIIHMFFFCKAYESLESGSYKSSKLDDLQYKKKDKGPSIKDVRS